MFLKMRGFFKMRTIKFRRYNAIENKMESIKTMNFDMKTNEVIYTTNNSICGARSPSCSPILQFTGIIDRKGTEIYEGDIVKFADGEISEVIFHCGCFMTKLKPGECIKLDFEAEPVWQDGEVIGNVFQNKELLNEIN